MKKEYSRPELEIYELDEVIMDSVSESIEQDIFGDDDEGSFGNL